MPKKKNQNKGKPKHATEESEDVVFRENVTENTEEEYTTVTDFEKNKKYCKRLIENNWSKYEANLSDFVCGDQGNEVPKTDDFNSLLKTASSDCSHFEFSSEKLWKADTAVPASKIFNLDVNVLSSGLACVPFYERLGLDEKELSAEDKERFDKAAEKSWTSYNLILEKLSKKPDEDTKVKKSDTDSHTLEESFKSKLDLEKYSEVDDGKTRGIQTGVDSGVSSRKEIEISHKNVGDNVGKNKDKFFSDNDENLEDWLDSVLDD